LFVVDTNILIHAAVEESTVHVSARRVISDWRDGTEIWFATWPILYEFLRVTTHRRVFREPFTFQESWRFLEALLAAPSFDILVQTDRHAEIVRDLSAGLSWASGNLMHDLHTAAIMKEHGIAEIRTTDTDFRKFPFLRVVDPLAA
jgi:toxin-antitoxin system PIN domain toxin